MPLFLLFVLGILLLLCGEMWALLNPTSRRLAWGVVSLALGCGAHISLFYISLKSGLTLNPHNKRHSFGLFISLYLCCVVDCIKTICSQVHLCLYPGTHLYS